MQPRTPKSRFLNTGNIKTFRLKKGGSNDAKRKEDAYPYPT